MKSGKTALPIELLGAPPNDWREPEWRFDLTLLDIGAVEMIRSFDDQLKDALMPDDEERDMELHVWVKPEVERDDYGVMLRPPNYVLSCDVSEGLEDGDYSGIMIRDANTMEAVASVKAHVPVEDLGAVTEWLGYWYHTALIGIERNNQGLVPLVYLADNEYPRIFRMDTLAQQKRGARTPRYGWYTNKMTKPKMVIDYTKALRREVLINHDMRFLSEARTFLFDGKGGYGASRGQHDDLTMAELINYQLCEDVGEYPIVYVDHGKKPITIGEVLEIGRRNAEKKEGVSPLYSPLGQPKRPAVAKESFEMMPQNVSTSERR
jgi:hypothetical protein